VRAGVPTGAEMSVAVRTVDGMMIDCFSCEARGKQCGDCLVTVLLNAPRREFEIDDDELRAFGALAEMGMVPPLRHVNAS
jgi:hypothetical protein